MKLPIYIILFLLVSISAFGQQNVFPDTFQNTQNTKEVIASRDCNGCKPSTKNEVFAQYIFNKSGLNTVHYSICKNEPCGKQIYNYQGEQLISYQNYGTWVSTSSEGDFGMVWDSTILTNDVQYQYEGAKLVNMKWIDGQDSRLSFEINYTYDKEGRLKKEEIKNYPDPNSFGRFEPNTDKWIDDPDAKKFHINTKEYSYQNSLVTVKCFKEDILTAIETEERNKQGKTVKSTLKDTSGKILKQLTYTYNDKGKVTEKSTTETGYDGFGNPYDYFGYEKETYEYDEYGNLLLKKLYSGGKIFIEEKFDYKK